MEKPPENILLVSLNNLGDCVMFLPVAAALRRHYPKARMTFLTGRVGEEVGRMTGLFDEFLVPSYSPKGRKVKHRSSLLRLISPIRKLVCDLGLMASGESSYVCAALFLGGVKRRVGFNDCKLRFLLTDRVEARAEENEARRNLRLLSALEIPQALQQPCCIIPPELAERARELLRVNASEYRQAGPLVLVHPGSSTPNRRWPAGHFAELCNRLHDSRPVGLVLLEGPAEPGLGREIQQLASCPIAVLKGIESIALLAAIISQCDIFIGNSTGPMHLASMLGTPSVSLWGPTDPNLWGPAWNKERHTVIQSPLACAGCERWEYPGHVIVRGRPSRAACGTPASRPETLPCMEAITVESVVEAVARQLREHVTP